MRGYTDVKLMRETQQLDDLLKWQSEIDQLKLKNNKTEDELLYIKSSDETFNFFNKIMREVIDKKNTCDSYYGTIVVDFNKDFDEYTNLWDDSIRFNYALQIFKNLGYKTEAEKNNKLVVINLNP